MKVTTLKSIAVELTAEEATELALILSYISSSQVAYDLLGQLQDFAEIDYLDSGMEMKNISEVEGGGLRLVRGESE